MPVPITPSKRARIVELADLGWSTRAIAKKYSVSSPGVSKIVRRHNVLGNMKSYPQSGAPRKLTVRQERQIVRLVTSGEENIAQKMAHQVDAEVSASTVRRVLHRAGLYGRVKVSKPLLTRKHKIARANWAKDLLNWTQDQKNSIIFSDESSYNLFGSNGRQWCWRRVGEELLGKNIKKNVKHGGGSVMVWGCITQHGVGKLVKCEGRVNSLVYQEILDEGLISYLEEEQIPTSQVIFQQDNAPGHASKSTKEYLKDNNINVMSWPAQSADMNIIENVWAHLETKLRQRPVLPTNINQLWQALEEEWYQIDAEFIQALYSSFNRRIVALNAAKGGYTRY